MIYHKICEECGNTFETKYKVKKYCSSKCAKRADNKRQWKKIKDLKTIERRCKKCNNYFTTSNSKKVYCDNCTPDRRTHTEEYKNKQKKDYNEKIKNTNDTKKGKYTEDEDKFLIENWNKVKVEEIALKLNRTYVSVRARYRKLAKPYSIGLKKKNFKNIFKENNKIKESIQQQIWNYLKDNMITTKQELIVNLNIKEQTVAQYISALYKANYLIYCLTSKRPFVGDKFKIIKHTGDKAPLFDKGLLKDFNTKEEIKISKSTKLNKQEYKYQGSILKDVLDSFLEVNKEEVYLGEVSKIYMTKTKDLKTKYGNSFLKRWVKKLENTNAITPTGNTYRNSKIYFIDLKKIKEIRTKLDDVIDYNLLFDR